MDIYPLSDRRHGKLENPVGLVHLEVLFFIRDAWHDASQVFEQGLKVINKVDQVSSKHFIFRSNVRTMIGHTDFHLDGALKMTRFVHCLCI